MLFLVKYAFMEWVLARIVAFYLAPQMQPLPLPALQMAPQNPSSRLQRQPSQILDVVPESVSRTASIEDLPLPTLIPRRIPLNREPDISYETEVEVMRTYQRQEERRRSQGRNSQMPGPSAGIS